MARIPKTPNAACCMAEPQWRVGVCRVRKLYNSWCSGIACMEANETYLLHACSCRGSKFSPTPNQPFPERIVVPFPVESKLSGEQCLLAAGQTSDNPGWGILFCTKSQPHSHYASATPPIISLASSILPISCIAVTSWLTGICRQGPESHHMWYRRTFSVPQGWAGQQVLVHFGAVDWQTQVWVNNIQLGNHFGG